VITHRCSSGRWGIELRGAIDEYLCDPSCTSLLESRASVLRLAEYRDWLYTLHPELETRLPEATLHASMFAESHGLDAIERDAMRGILARVFGCAMRRHGADSFHDYTA
jgi:hypothetical protein